MKNPIESRVLSSKYRPHDQINKKHQPYEPDNSTESVKNLIRNGVCVKRINLTILKLNFETSL
jgi:hypothetical protein